MNARAPFFAALTLSALLGGAACAHHRARVVYVYVPTAPPPEAREVVVRSPGPGYVWIPGHHRWDGHVYVWVSGRWERPPARRGHWVSGRWHHDQHGWFWVEGHWS